ncbi:alpha/beta fold hydrolase [Saccharothrix sp. HUAS TT1]|uniref:alpha/beta fold hydrolase n=1 Tax=unclassified Saccharothrix TaxID=2593673 RepID=UPI00345B752B
MKKLRTLLLVVGLLFALTAGAQKPAGDPALAGLGRGFVSGTAHVNGTTLHYVRGGRGPAIVLLHGYPQDWTEYRDIMPALAKRFTVVAPDLRGVGRSAAPLDGYDAPNLAEDVRQLAQRLNLGKVYVVGHDVGGMVAYAYARLNPRTTRGAMVLDVPLPGIDPWDETTGRMWHIGFHQVPGLPEALIADRQAVYFRYTSFSDTETFSDADVDRYAAAYAKPDQLRAGFEFYRAFPENGEFNAAQRGRSDVPLVWAAGGRSPFADLGPEMAESLRAQGSTDVTTAVVPDSDHFVVNAQPEFVTRMIERHAS